MKYRIFINIIILASLLIFCSPDTETRKIKLSDVSDNITSEDQITSSIHLEPASRRAVAVMFFDNMTGDYNLDWLKQGLTEMFIRTLSQSQRISVLSTDRLYELTERLGGDTLAGEIDMDMAAVFAQRADVEAYLTGNISKSGDSLRISVQLHESVNGRVIREASAEGPGLVASHSV